MMVQFIVKVQKYKETNGEYSIVYILFFFLVPV